MRLKRFLATTVAIGAITAGGAVLAQPATAVENQPPAAVSSPAAAAWKYWGEYTTLGACQFSGRYGLAFRGWNEYQCWPAGDSWDLVYR
jgi:hypothetical protein